MKYSRHLFTDRNERTKEEGVCLSSDRKERTKEEEGECVFREKGPSKLCEDDLHEQNQHHHHQKPELHMTSMPSEVTEECGRTNS